MSFCSDIYGLLDFFHDLVSLYNLCLLFILKVVVIDIMYKYAIKYMLRQLFHFLPS